MKRILLLAASAALALCGPAAASAAARSDAAPVDAAPAASVRAAPALPEPTGTHRIGRVALHLVDRDRADPWVPQEKRELMVSLWYPARTPSSTPAAYMTAAESQTYVQSNDIPVPPDALAKITTHSTVGAAPVRPRGGLPLVLLSPGYGMPRATLTGLAEELASRGYAVAAIGHNYEAYGISFPDGHTTSCVICGAPDDRKTGDTRAADVSFVLDELTGTHPAWKGGPLIDTERTAMVGHSAGGFSTIPAMLRDARVKAAVNMDGNFRYLNELPVDRPMLMLGQPAHVPGGEDPTWDKTWNQLTDWKRWLSVDGMQHLSFTDLAVLAKQFGIPLQELDGDRADALTRAYVAAFVDTHLRGRHVPLLDGPSSRFPEVKFQHP